jgi:hypothetical protein
MELSIVILQILWDKIDIVLSVYHIKDNTHLAEIRQNIRTTHFNVLFRQDILKVKPEHFMGNHQLNCFASSAIHQLEHFVPGSNLRFHTIDCGFMNNLYYHTSTTRNVYNYNNVRRWVKNIKLLDYDYVFIPTNNNKLHWVVFVIVPAQRRVKCYDSLHDANDFHYESLNVIIRFIKDYQSKNQLQVDDWSWSVRMVSAPKQNNLYDRGVFVCMRMYCMMKV